MSQQSLNSILLLAFAVESMGFVAGAIEQQDQMTPSSTQTDKSLIREQRIFLKPGHEPKMMAKLEGFARKAKREDGAIAYRLFKNVEHPNEVMIFEQWRDDAAWTVHMEQGYVKELIPKNGVGYTRKPVTLTEFGRDGHLYASAPQRQSEPATVSSLAIIKEQRITVNRGIDVEGLKTALTELAKATREEPGNTAFRLFEVISPATEPTNEPTKLVLLEEWAGQQWLDRHKSSATLTDFFKKYGHQFERQPVSWQEVK